MSVLGKVVVVLPPVECSSDDMLCCFDDVISQPGSW